MEHLQQKKDIIAIHGPIACGKSSVVEVLRDKEKGGFYSHYGHYSTGDTARAMAQAKGMNIEEYLVYARKNNIPYDSILDEGLKDINNGHSQWIVDSRLGYFFIPESFKVYLAVNPQIAAERRHAQLVRKDSEKYKNLTVEDVMKDLNQRNMLDQQKYLELYGTDCFDESNYDYVIDTTLPRWTEYVVAGEIILKHTQWLKKHGLSEFSLNR